jgi:hypothetical protein
MKTKMAIMLAVALLCGCQQKNQSDTARLTALETTVSNLQWLGERRRDAINFNASNDDWTFSNQNVLNSNLVAFIQTNATQIETLQLAVAWEAAKLQSMDGAVSNIAGRLHVGYDDRYYTYPAAGNLTIPSDVYRQIISDAQAEWPNDYSMQQFKIKQETTAWLQLHGRLPNSN